MTVFANPIIDRRRLTPRESDSVIRILTDAFASDPVIRWMYPADETYRVAFPQFLRAFGGPAFTQGTVVLERRQRAAALWLAPGSGPDDEAIEQCLLETVASEKHQDLFAVFSDMEAAHPDFEHWYLPWFGTDPEWQSQGVGSALMQHCLEAVDDARLPTYLETPNPRNIPFYERQGFELLGRSQHGNCPPVAFMLRPPR